MTCPLKYNKCQQKYSIIQTFKLDLTKKELQKAKNFGNYKWMDEEKCLKKNKLCDKGQKVKGFSGLILTSALSQNFCWKYTKF